MRAFLVAVAGAAGALARYGIGMAVSVQSFPWATLGINTIGSALLGFLLAGPAGERFSTDTNVALAVGFLGAFTTFSTFTYEAWTLLRTDRAATAAVYVFTSVLLGLTAAATGYMLGRATV